MVSGELTNFMKIPRNVGKKRKKHLDRADPRQTHSTQSRRISQEHTEHASNLQHSSAQNHHHTRNSWIAARQVPERLSLRSVYLKPLSDHQDGFNSLDVEVADQDGTGCNQATTVKPRSVAIAVRCLCWLSARGGRHWRACQGCCLSSRSWVSVVRF